MKYVAMAIMVVLIGFANVAAQDIPVKPNPTFSLSAFMNVERLSSGYNVGWTRIFPSFRAGAYEISIEFDVSGVDDDVRMEVLNQFRLIYRPDSSTALMIGRNFRAFGYATFAPVLLKTAQYPGGYPFSGYYAYGARVDRTQSFGALGVWNIKADITATSAGYRTYNWDRPEFSWYAGHSHGENLSYGFAGQYSGKFSRWGVSTETGVDDFLVVGGIFITNNCAGRVSGITLLQWRKWQMFQPHLQYYSSPGTTPVWLAGVALLWDIGDLELKFIADSDRDNLFMRTQLKF